MNYVNAQVTDIVAVGDFNGDGKADLIVAGNASGFSVMLGGATRI